MNNKIIVTIDAEQALKQTDDIITLFDRSQKVIIRNQSEYNDSAIFLKEIKSRFKEIEKKRKEITVPIDEAKSKIMDLFRKPLDLLRKAEETVKDVMGVYDSEMERKAKEDQARLQRLADMEAEKQKRIIDEKIARAEASGKLERAEALAQQKEEIIPIVAPVITPSIETPKGVSYRDKWDAEITDINLVPREYLIPDMQALNKLAQATKNSLKIPGVKFVCTKVLSSR